MPSSNTISSSRLKNIRNLEPRQRLELVANNASLDQVSINALSGSDSLPLDLANGMIENAIGKFELPLGIAANFLVNDRDYLIPMAVEEPSVIAAASYMAKIVRDHGGFSASSDAPIMRAQVQITNLDDPHGAKMRLLGAAAELISIANDCDKMLESLGGGCKGLEVQVFDDTPIGPMVVLHIKVDVRDAMGANAVNTMAEAIAPRVAEVSGGDVRMRILSNLADLRLARASLRVPTAALTTASLNGEDVASGIVEAFALAMVDPYRAATHNKGIMNGIDPVVVATGNDWRAIEAGAHAYAARNGRYGSLTHWERARNGDLVGSIELPMAVGIIGGATKTHPAAQAALRTLKVQSAQELAEVIAAVGLAQNMAALRALATEGIQKGHMALHARNIAITAGAKGDNIKSVAEKLVDSGVVTVDRARALLAEG